MKSIKFVKMHGAGNDFILIDNREGLFPGTDDKLIRKLCSRHLGIGADGLMLIRFTDPAEFSLQYFNADGFPASMCGNGARCAVYFVHLLNRDYERFSFSVSGVSYSGQVTDLEKVRIVWSGLPDILPDPGIQEEIPEQFSRYLYVDSGVPHLVLEAAAGVDNIDVEKWGAFFRNHPSFAPAGTNVNFISRKNSSIQIRTFERGVEGETLACGTGAIAAAMAALRWFSMDPPVQVVARGGVLLVGINERSGMFWLEGPVRKVFDGMVDLESF